MAMVRSQLRYAIQKSMMLLLAVVVTFGHDWSSSGITYGLRLQLAMMWGFTMSSTNYLSLFLIIIAAEVFLNATWNKFYFRLGIPILRRRTDVKNAELVLDATVMRTTFIEGEQEALPIRFHDLKSNAVIFREGLNLPNPKSKRVVYSPLMRGILKFDPSQGQIVLVGLLNWSYLISFPLIVFSLFDDVLVTGAEIPPTRFVVLAFMLVMVGTIYRTQRNRFIAVADAAASIWDGE
jgi:hypothetical protein